MEYGYLKLTGREEKRGNSILYVEAECICGEVIFFRLSRLKSGRTKSCGCKKVELQRLSTLTHGLTSKVNNLKSLYTAYMNMVYRCTIPSTNGYENYGGRGISVCSEWINDINSFTTWSLNNGWEKSLSLERKKVNYGYNPDNCCWIKLERQPRNRTDSIIITAFGETKQVNYWAEDKRCVVGISSLKTRIDRNWDSERAIITPAGKQGTRKKINDSVN